MASSLPTASAIDSIKSLLRKITACNTLRINYFCQFSNGRDCTFYKINFTDTSGHKVGYISYDVNTNMVYRARYRGMRVALPSELFDLLLDIYNYEKCIDCN